MVPSCCLLALIPFLLGTPDAQGLPLLTLDRRVAAQAALERVSYAHQTGATLPFDQAVPPALIRRKVLTYLKQSQALERFWGVPVTGDLLAAEAARMARGTRMPERLRELQEALGNDPLLVQECLVRPALVGRLARQLFAADSRIHRGAREAAIALHRRLKNGDLSLDEAEPHRVVMRIGRSGSSSAGATEGTPGQISQVLEEEGAFVFRAVLREDERGLDQAVYRLPKRSWDEWWSEVEPSLEPAALTAVPTPAAVEPPAPLDGCPAEGWTPTDPGYGSKPRTGHTAVWTGAEVIVFGGDRDEFIGTGERYNPATNTWSAISLVGAPRGREKHTAVWTGQQMVVWGGIGASYPVPESGGGRYDPLTDTWSQMAPAPEGLFGHTAVWTGTEMIVYGGSLLWNGSVFATTTDGLRYDPLADAWSFLPGFDNSSWGRADHTAVWTGSRMIVWGGYCKSVATSPPPCVTEGALSDGAIWDPATGWTALPAAGAPAARSGHTAVWTGSRMVVWGGTQGASGGRYDFASNTWAPVSTTNAPSGQGTTSVWDGQQVIVWGGTTAGRRYDPEGDTWSSMATLVAPAPRTGHTATWTGDSMLLWGGAQGPPTILSRYVPSSNSWTSRTLDNPLPVRQGHVALWTGTRMLIWGGIHGQYSGVRYDPALDSWTPMAELLGQPWVQWASTVWTGQFMVMWGGTHSGTYVSTGQRYDPIADAWSPTSTSGAPAARAQHAGVWSGSEMLVWGGTGCGTACREGGLYDPSSNAWSAMEWEASPPNRPFPLAVWAGDRMVLWGSGSDPNVTTGSRYDPVNDAWEAMSASPLPGSTDYSVITTGSEMILWGGRTGATGARYDPAADVWTTLALAGAPSDRRSHSAVWSGSEMIVWGGLRMDNSATREGARYDPVMDSWLPTTLADGPTARHLHTAVWDGQRMIIWGGATSAGTTSTGGLYRPAAVDQDQDGQSACDGDCDDGNPVVYQGAPELCDGLRNDCGAAWDVLWETDNDGDGLSECQNDCNDADGASWSPPGPVDLSLTFDGGTGVTTLQWVPPAAGGGTSLVFDVLESATTFDLEDAMCRESDDADTLFVDPPVSPVPELRFYLVRAQNGCPGTGTGSLGTRSDGTPRTGPDCTP